MNILLKEDYANTVFNYDFVKQNVALSNFLQYINHILTVSENYNLNKVDTTIIRNVLSNSLLYKQLEWKTGFMEAQQKIVNFASRYVEHLRESNENVLKLADEFWKVYIKNTIAVVEATEIILKKIEVCKDCYLILDTDMPYKRAISIAKRNDIKYIIFKSKREGYDIRTLIDSCRFKDEISKAEDIEEARKASGIKELIYIDVHGKLCCTKTLESAIQIVKYNESIKI